MPQPVSQRHDAYTLAEAFSPQGGSHKDLFSHFRTFTTAYSETLTSCSRPVILNLIQDLNLRSRAAARIIRDVAGVTSGSTKRVGSLRNTAPCRKFGFTLAEVLITLGIIGVVAAMTMPTLMAQHRKQVVETRLAKFYSVINQAITTAEVEHGPISYWDNIVYENILDEDGNDTNIARATNALEWYNKYLAKHLNTIKVENTNDYEGSIAIYFADGSLLFGGITWKFYPNAKDFVLLEQDGKIDRDKNLSGKKYFTFTRTNSCKNGQFVPYGTCNSLHNSDTSSGYKNNNAIGCKETVTNERALCTLMIAKNGWKIPKDYPLKF